jgi:PadR family transcriptional regulator PadR
MKLENVKAQMRKGILEYCILSMLSGKYAYASDIISDLKNAKMIVVEGTLYPLLTRLKNGELLSYRWEESTSGPPRKYYTLTEAGEKFLKEMDSSWEELLNAINYIKNTKTESNE